MRVLQPGSYPATRPKDIPQTVQTIQQHGSNMSDKELGLLLINAGYLTQDDILMQSAAILYGHCPPFVHLGGGLSSTLITDLLPPEDRISVRLDLENLIIEGSRQLREWEQLTG